jgi:hypothetical protein
MLAGTGMMEVVFDASSSDEVEMNVQLETPTAERLFRLPCGCVAVNGNGASFDVRWCPHHQALHGEVPIPLRPSAPPVPGRRP